MSRILMLEDKYQYMLIFMCPRAAFLFETFKQMSDYIKTADMMPDHVYIDLATGEAGKFVEEKRDE